MFIYFRDREHKKGRGREREGDTESETDSRLWAVIRDPDVGFELTKREIMTWAKVRHLTDWATQSPQKQLFTLIQMWGTWVAQSVKCPTLGFSSGRDLTVYEMEPWVRLCTDSVVPAWNPLSPSVSPSQTK